MKKKKWVWSRFKWKQNNKAYAGEININFDLQTIIKNLKKWIRRFNE